MSFLTRFLDLILFRKETGNGSELPEFSFEHLDRRISGSTKRPIDLNDRDYFVRCDDKEVVYQWFETQKRARVIDRKTGRPSGDPVKLQDDETFYYVAEHVLR